MDHQHHPKFLASKLSSKNMSYYFCHKLEIKKLTQIFLFSYSVDGCHSIKPPPPTRPTFGPKKWGKSEKNVCMGGGGGDLKNSCHGYLPGGEGGLLCFLSKKDLNKIWLWGLNFNCQSWPVLVKQPINV